MPLIPIAGPASRFYPVQGGGGDWLLAGGTWNDSGVWDDSAVWEDS